MTPPRKKPRRLRRLDSEDFVHVTVGTPASRRDAQLPKSRGTKLTKLEKYPALVQVVGSWNADHEAERAADKPVSFGNLHFSFLKKLPLSKQVQDDAGEAASLPSSLSLGWFCNMKKKLGVRNVAVQSTEAKRVTAGDVVDFKAAIARKRQEHSVLASCVVVADESNAFRMPTPKRVQSAPTESKRRTSRRVRRTLGGRESYTIIVTYSVSKKGKLMVLAHRCSLTMRRQINRDFGDHIHLITGKGTNMNGTLHAREFLPNVVAPFASQCLAQRDASAHCLYVEDRAPCHTGDACRQTRDVELKAARRNVFSSNNIVRELLPANGSPDHAAPGQMFKVIKMMTMDALNEIAGVGNDLATIQQTIHSACQIQVLRLGGRIYIYINYYIIV